MQSALQTHLRKILQAKGLDISYAAELSGISRATIHNWIAGRSEPRSRTLHKFMRALDLNPEDILGVSQTA